MDLKKPEEVAKNGTVHTLHIAPRVRSVPPLSDAEILALRKLLIEMESIKEACPVVKRALSDR